jgi:hypothetical protein
MCDFVSGALEVCSVELIVVCRCPSVIVRQGDLGAGEQMLRGWALS